MSLVCLLCCDVIVPTGLNCVVLDRPVQRVSSIQMWCVECQWLLQQSGHMSLDWVQSMSLYEHCSLPWQRDLALPSCVCVCMCAWGIGIRRKETFVIVKYKKFLFQFRYNPSWPLTQVDPPPTWSAIIKTACRVPGGDAAWKRTQREILSANLMDSLLHVLTHIQII